jgi:hypothetical protein
MSPGDLGNVKQPIVHSLLRRSNASGLAPGWLLRRAQKSGPQAAL